MPDPPIILLVDDTDAQRYALGRVLRNGGYHVLEAASAEEALVQVKRHPDLVLLDVGLPGMNGYEVCKRIKSDPDTSSIPVLQMSASYVSTRHKVMALDGGADGYLTPPLEGPELLANVKAMLRLSSAEQRAGIQAAEIAATRAELHAVMQSIADSLVRVDKEGRIGYVNHAAERLLGYPGSVIRGRMFHDFVHREGRACSHAERCPLADITAHSVGTRESVFFRKDGTPVTVEFTSSPYVVNENVEGIVVSFRDIGERKRSEDALRITEKLANTGRMAATIAHEINNPLEAITNLVYLISVAPELEDDTRQYVDMAQAELARVTHISKQTLGFYRQSNLLGEFSVADVTEGVLVLLERKLTTAHIQVEKRFETKAKVHGYAGEIRQVISNLVLNAMEAIGSDGKLLVHIYESRDFRNGNRGVRFVLLDSGPGIPPSKKSSIFEPFFTTKQERGTGLGLWVSHGIVHKHGGYMRVHSSQGAHRHGTCFSIFLPFER